MNPIRYASVLAAQTVVARKVFDAVPVETYWNSRQIHRELVRIQAPIRDLRLVEGCLNTLVEARLVREHPRGQFARILPRIEPLLTVAVQETATPPVEAPVTVSSTPEASNDPVEDHGYHFEDVVVAGERDWEYEYYLNLRFERVEKMLRLLSDHVDDEMGLALLEVAEDLSNTHELQLEYYSSRGPHTESRVVVNPGWYHHEIKGVHVFDVFTKKEVLSDEDKQHLIDEHRRGLADAIAESNNLEGSRILQEQSEKEIETIFQKFDAELGDDHTYYDSLLNKLRTHVPDIDPVAELEPKVEVPTTASLIQERKNRRGMCDVKIRYISQAPEYRAWMGIIAPGNLKVTQEQGLEVEEIWLKSFAAFLKDVGYRPEFGARLYRIDTDLGWIKDNVEWRIQGRVIPAGRRAPPGWPAVANQDRAKRGLKLIYDNAVQAIDKIGK